MRIINPLITNAPALFTGFATLSLGFINFLSNQFDKNQQQLADQKEKINILLEKSLQQMEALERIRSEVALSKQQTLAVVHTGNSHADQNLIILLFFCALIVGVGAFAYHQHYYKQDNNTEATIKGIAKNLDISLANSKESNIEILDFTDEKCNQILKQLSDLEIQILENTKKLHLAINKLDISINSIDGLNSPQLMDINSLSQNVLNNEQALAKIHEVFNATQLL